MKRKLLLCLSALFVTGSILTACGGGQQASNDVISTETEQATEVVTEVETETEVEPPFEEYDISLMAVGDNLMHMGIVRAGEMADGTRDYSVLFEGIADFLDTADIKIINQETILGGNHLGFSGYPLFNSPTEVGDAIAAAGFNVVLHASNHSADKGLDGLLNCIELWKTHPEVLMVGIHEEAAEVHNIPILTIGDIDFAILNYTYSPNMETLPASMQGRLDMLCYWDENTGRIDMTRLHPKVEANIKVASELADVVIVCPHWGVEYVTSPSQYQEQFAKQMVEAGADLIIGTHPHVVQPVEWVESENGNRALCFYSLGNYLSTQKGALNMFEAMAWVTFRVTEDGVVINEEKTGAIPIVCHYNSGPVRFEGVYPLDVYTEEDAARHGIRNYGGVNLLMSDMYRWTDEILGEWAMSVDEVLSEDTETMKKFRELNPVETETEAVQTTETVE